MLKKLATKLSGGPTKLPCYDPKCACGYAYECLTFSDGTKTCKCVRV